MGSSFSFSEFSIQICTFFDPRYARLLCNIYPPILFLSNFSYSDNAMPCSLFSLSRWSISYISICFWFMESFCICIKRKDLQKQKRDKKKKKKTLSPQKKKKKKKKKS